jgi:hypothetical protein
MNYNKECELCFIYGEQEVKYQVGCKILCIVKAEECPCQICLLKMVCTNTCEEYDELIKKGVRENLL